MNAGSFGEAVASAVPIIRKVVVTSLADKPEIHAEIAWITTCATSEV